LRLESQHTKIDANGTLVNFVAHDVGCVKGVVWEGEKMEGAKVGLRWGGGQVERTLKRPR
jgi:hypothetical protein